MTVLYAVIPIILNAAGGFVAMRRAIFDKAFLDAFSRLTFRYFIPCLLFAGMVRADLGSLARVRLFWLAYFVPAIIIFLLVRLRRTSTMSLAVTYSNSVMIGIPLVLRAFGDDGLSATLTIISVNGLTLFTMVALTRGTLAGPSAGVASVDAPASRWRTNLLNPITTTLKNPIIIGLLLGATVNFLAIPIFEPLLEAIALVGRGALPSALFILGASLATVSTASISSERKTVALICLVKLIIMPALVFLTARQLLHLDPLSASVLVTLAACPSGINVLPFAQQSERETRIVSAGIFVSTIVSIFTLPIWIYLLTL